ncbi:MAG: hypothetical protein K2Q26_13445 [Bdellovibrionales bacterium]|nr:hypothetical protein [Bdellovibrionales bacterium]
MNKLKVILAFSSFFLILATVAILFKKNSNGSFIGYQIRRSELDKHTKSFVTQLEDIKITPRIIDEQTQCYEFKDIKKDTFFAALYIQENDCIISFNDEPFNSPMSAMKFYETITKTTSETLRINLVIDRNGSQILQELTIR